MEYWRITYGLRRTSKGILISSSFWSLECMPFDKICDRVFWTPTMHNLLCGILSIRICYVCPGHVTKILAALQFLCGFTHLKQIIAFTKLVFAIQIEKKLCRKLQNPIYFNSYLVLSIPVNNGEAVFWMNGS